MELCYKIIDVNELENSIVVRFYTDEITEQELSVDSREGAILRARTDYNINLPHPIPQGKDLENFILSQAPIYWFRMKAKAKKKELDFSSLHPLIGKEVKVIIKD